MKKEFIVKPHLDLNNNLCLNLPYGSTAKKEFCCDYLHCRNEPVLANFSVDKSNI